MSHFLAKLECDVFGCFGVFSLVCLFVGFNVAFKHLRSCDDGAVVL